MSFVVYIWVVPLAGGSVSWAVKMGFVGNGHSGARGEACVLWGCLRSQVDLTGFFFLILFIFFFRFGLADCGFWLGWVGFVYQSKVNSAELNTWNYLCGLFLVVDGLHGEFWDRRKDRRN
ncbi:hypothetical protein N657DRAFT_133912 [Parathielavia appendiculata]|uniref:Uncharacterized protein n=1 Tax=Parathielavia appendiculata TaxID=2587402 RepID=A0AAN6TVM0_9PEZI|nr:hypothetical protein N657DRAFT_133912 [Parathielavia appendiculata]